MIRGIIPYHVSRTGSLAIIPLVLLMSLGSCIREEFNTDVFDPTLQINPGVAAPIGWARYRLDEILFDSLNPGELIISEDGSITFIYQQDLYSLFASGIINIPKMITGSAPVNNPLGISFNLLTLPGDTSFIDTISFTIPVNGTTDAEIDSIRLSRGEMSVEVTSAYPELRWGLRILIPGRTDWGITLDDDHTSATDTLDGFTLPLMNNPTAKNQLRFALELSMDSMDVTIDPGAVLNITISLSNLDYSVIYGYLGYFRLNVGPVVMPVYFFNGLEDGTFSFKDPELNIEFLNSFGLPVSIDTLELLGIGRGGQITPVTGTGIPGPGNEKIIAYPVFGQEGMSISDSIILTRQNTDLFDVLETSPSGISVEMNGSTNPAGLTHDNFILDTSKLSVRTILTLPMEGKAEFLLMSDTLDFIFGGFYDQSPEEIKQLIFRMNFRHQFPVNVDIQVYFYDEAWTLLDSLFHDVSDPKRIIEGSDQFDSKGVADVVSRGPVEVPLTPDQINKISNSHYMIVKAKITTTGTESGEDVKFYSFYFLDAYLGVIADLELNSDDL